MVVKKAAIDAAFSAMDRLINQRPVIARNAFLTDRNLAIESGISRATLARSQVIMDRWRNIKFNSAKMAFDELLSQPNSGPDPLTDRALIARARIDLAAFIRLPRDFVKEWEEFKSRRSAALSPGARHDRDVPIRSLVAKIYALTCAVRQRDEVISKLEARLRNLEELFPNDGDRS